MKNLKDKILMIFLFVVLSGLAFAKNSAGLSAEQKTEIIHKTIQLLNDRYVFPETAKEMEKVLRANLQKGKYAKISDPKEFAVRLTKDLQAVSRDLHLRVGYSAEVLPADPEDMFEPTEAELEPLRQEHSRENFGVRKVEILDGNIGLIRFDYFTNPAWAGDVYTAALNYVAGTDAIIIDLRNNLGSMNENAIPFICSYFFERPVQLSSIYWRPKDFTKQFWTYSIVPGRRFVNKPIYILTSRRTFSGGEAIAYDLKNLKRATVVGETTGGGANGGGEMRINDHFSVWIPQGRLISPITKTNWEGTGVSPDIEIAPNKALYKAQLLALEHTLKTVEDKKIRENLQKTETAIKQKLQNFRKVVFKLKGFETAENVNLAGDFNNWSRRSVKMTKANGEWIAEYEIEPGRHAYKFIVDGKWITDPANPKTEKSGEVKNSVIEIN